MNEKISDVSVFNDPNKSIIQFALHIGELMLTNGAETYRAEDTVVRICKSRKLNHINCFTSPTVIIVSDYRFDGYSLVKNIKSRSTNLNRISALNNISRKFVSNPSMTVKEAYDELDQLFSGKTYSTLNEYLSTGVGCALFAGLVGGNDINTLLTTFITSMIALKIFKKTYEISSISAFSSLVCAAFIATIGVILTQLNILTTPGMLIVGAIMPILPGVSFIQGLRDLISGDLISGVARAFDAGVTAISIACGVGIVLDVWFTLGGVLL